MQQVSERPQCPACGKDFTSVKYLKQHGQYCRGPPNLLVKPQPHQRRPVGIPSRDPRQSMVFQSPRQSIQDSENPGAAPRETQDPGEPPTAPILPLCARTRDASPAGPNKPPERTPDHGEYRRTAAEVEDGTGDSTSDRNYSIAGRSPRGSVNSHPRANTTEPSTTSRGQHNQQRIIPLDLSIATSSNNSHDRGNPADLTSTSRRTPEEEGAIQRRPMRRR